MLLFVRKPYCHQLRNGTKTIEIRYGDRYRRIRPGHSISVNGQFRLSVERVIHCQTVAEVLDSLDGAYESAGMRDRDSCHQALSNCYPTQAGPFTLLHLRREQVASQ